MSHHSDFINHLCNERYAIWDNFLAAEHYQALVALSAKLYQQQRYEIACVGRAQQRQHEQKIRRDSISWIDQQSCEPAAGFFLDTLGQLLKQLNQQLFLGLWELECHFALYKTGSFYRRHRDQFQGKTDRKISCVYYLNELWQKEDGGNLIIYDDHSDVMAEVLPYGNRLVCFQSCLEHEVLETRRQRVSIAAWMKTRPLLNL